MTLRAALFLAVLLAAPAGAQVSKPPATSTSPGSGRQAIRGGGEIAVPLPTLTPEQLEQQRRLEEEDRREMDERARREAAAMRNTPAGIHYCNQLEEWIGKAQAGPLPRYDGPPGQYATKEEQAAFLKDLTEKRDKFCR